MSDQDIALTATGNLGRVLLALRAGPMSSGELYGRFPSLPSMTELVRKGYCTGNEDGYRITAAGRAVCPLRNPLAGKLEKPVASSLSRVTALIGLPLKTAAHPTIRRSEKPENTGDFQMPTNPSDDTLSAVNQLRGILVALPGGVARKDLIKQTGLTAARVDNAIANLIKIGEAERKAYGVIAAVASGVASMAARMQVKTPVIAAPAPAPAAPAAPAPAPAVVDEPEVDFMIHADGRLTIDYGDEIFVLPPDATHRLYRFLGRFSQSAAV